MYAIVKAKAKPVLYVTYYINFPLTLLNNCLLAWNQWRRNMISGEEEPVLMDYVSTRGGV